jgi:hypothetical protein
LDKFTVKDNEFWQQLKTTAVMMISGKGVLQHLKDIKPAVMTVGGFLMPKVIRPKHVLQTIEKAVKLQYNCNGAMESWIGLNSAECGDG